MFISNKKSIDYECNLEHITNCICTWGIEKICFVFEKFTHPCYSKFRDLTQTKEKTATRAC